MGNKQSVNSHLENAQRTGVFQLTNAKLTEIPSNLFNVKTLRSIDLSTNRPLIRHYKFVLMLVHYLLGLN